MKSKEILQEQLEQKNRDELLHFALSQYEVYNDLLSGYETAHELLMASGVCLFDVVQILHDYLPKETEKQQKIKRELTRFFIILQKNETIRQYNNFHSNGRY